MWSCGRGAEPHGSSWGLSKDRSSQGETPGSGDVLSGSYSFPQQPPTDKPSSAPQTQRLSLPQPCQRPVWGPSWTPCMPLQGSWELSRALPAPAAGSTSPASLSASLSKGPCARAQELEEQSLRTNLPPPSSFPSPRDGVEHIRRRGSHGYKATVHPRLILGEAQHGPVPGKCRTLINPPAPLRAQRLQHITCFYQQPQFQRGGSGAGLSQHFSRARCSAEIPP